MATQRKDDRLNIRINSELKAKGYKCAQSEGISITDFVARVLTLYVRDAESRD